MNSATINMTTLRVALCSLVLATLAGCAAAYRNLEAPTVSLVSIATAGIEADMSVRLTTRLQLTNPNGITLPVRGGKLDLAINGTEIGSVDIDEGFDLPAEGSEIIALPVRLDLRKALEVGVSTLGANSSDIDYKLGGYIDLGTRYFGRLPINREGQINLGGG